jgi:hypothetical protein
MGRFIAPSRPTKTNVGTSAFWVARGVRDPVRSQRLRGRARRREDRHRAVLPEPHGFEHEPADGGDRKRRLVEPDFACHLVDERHHLGRVRPAEGAKWSSVDLVEDEIEVSVVFSVDPAGVGVDTDAVVAAAPDMHAIALGAGREPRRRRTREHDVVTTLRPRSRHSVGPHFRSTGERMLEVFPIADEDAHQTPSA